MSALTHFSCATAKQIQILDDKVQTIKNLIKKLERGGKGTKF